MRERVSLCTTDIKVQFWCWYRIQTFIFFQSVLQSFFMFFHFFDQYSFFQKSQKLNSDSSTMIQKSLIFCSKFCYSGTIIMKKIPHRFQSKILAILAYNFGNGQKSKSCWHKPSVPNFAITEMIAKTQELTIDYYSASNFSDLPPSQKRQQQPI